MALAARDVIMKRDSVSGKRIRFIGIDGVYGDGAGLQAVADEKLEASFQYPTGGAISIQVAMQIINGEKVKKNYVLNTAIINRGMRRPFWHSPNNSTTTRKESTGRSRKKIIYCLVSSSCATLLS